MNTANSAQLAFGIGIATQNQAGEILECWFHTLGIGSKSWREKFQSS
jgi:hypothetical protein